VPTPLPASFYDRDPVEVGPELLGKLLVRGELVARIVEVEAYRGEQDAASHAFGGPRARCATMFGPPGRLYVYFTYGMHYCANIVCWPEGRAGAVLLRALSPVAGIDVMRLARGAAQRRASLPRNGAPRRPLSDTHLLSGPARLCQAFGIEREFDGIDLTDKTSEIIVVDDHVPPPDLPGSGPRVGLGVRVGETAAEVPWRFWVPGDPNVSAGGSSAVARMGRRA
jgi:DNA-3-methyladenine glycosylase